MAQRKLSIQLQAVLLIFNADEELRCKALPHVDLERESIHWDNIWAGNFGGGHSAAVVWAKAIWVDDVTTKSDPFDRAFSMNPKLRRAVLAGLAMRWGLNT